MKGLWKENLGGYIKDCKRKKQPKNKFFRENLWHLRYEDKSDSITCKTETENTYKRHIPKKYDLVEIYQIKYKQIILSPIENTNGEKIFNYNDLTKYAICYGNYWYICNFDGVLTSPREYVIEENIYEKEIKNSFYDITEERVINRTISEKHKKLLKNRLYPANIWNLGFIYYRNSKPYQKIVNKQDRTIQRDWLNNQDFNFWLENRNYYNFLTEEVNEFLYNYDFRYAFYILDNECRDNIGINHLPTHQYSKSLKRVL
jgi:hypothetical protein